MPSVGVSGRHRHHCHGHNCHTHRLGLVISINSAVKVGFVVIVGFVATTDLIITTVLVITTGFVFTADVVFATGLIVVVSFYHQLNDELYLVQGQSHCHFRCLRSSNSSQPFHFHLVCSCG